MQNMTIFYDHNDALPKAWPILPRPVVSCIFMGKICTLNSKGMLPFRNLPVQFFVCLLVCKCVRLLAWRNNNGMGE